MPEIVFRVVGLILAISFMTVRSIYERRLGSENRFKKLKDADPRDRRGLLVVSVGSILMWLYFLSPWLDFAAMGLPDWLRWLGAAMTAASVGLFLWTHAALAGSWSPVVEAPPSGTLVTSGPYRFVRHPMYTAFFLHNLGLWLLSSNWLAGAAATLTFAYMYLDRVGREECMMLEAFGEQYRAYAEKTGRVVPGLGAGRLG